MKNFEHRLNELFLPVNAFVFYESESESEKRAYVEAYDISENGSPINGRPLCEEELSTFARLCQAATNGSRNAFKLDGLLPSNLLHLDQQQGSAIWTTPAGIHNLLFDDFLGIPSGSGSVPPMVWKATTRDLYVFALSSIRKPNLNTPLYKAPFFNIFDDGRVCTGSVEVDFTKTESIEQFIATWEGNFYNSYFSHMIGDISPTKSNVVQLWKILIETGEPFPLKELTQIGKSLNSLLA